MDFLTFWENMSEIANPTGLFSQQHFMTLLVMGVGGLLLIKGYKRVENKSAYRKWTAWSIVALEAARQLILVVTGQYTWHFLPLHLCALGVWAILIDSYKENKYTKEIIFMLTLPGAFAALMTPDWTAAPLLNFFTLQSFVIHALEVFYVWMRFAAQEIQPKFRNIWIPMAFLGIVLPIIMVINNGLGTNFFFTSEGPAGTPLAPMQAQFGALYVPALVGLVTLLWVAVYGLMGSKNPVRKTVSYLRGLRA